MTPSLSGTSEANMPKLTRNPIYRCAVCECVGKSHSRWCPRLALAQRSLDFGFQGRTPGELLSSLTVRTRSLIGVLPKLKCSIIFSTMHFTEWQFGHCPITQWQAQSTEKNDQELLLSHVSDKQGDVRGPSIMYQPKASKWT